MLLRTKETNLQREGKIISIQNLNEYTGFFNLTHTQFCLLPGSLSKTLFVSVSPFSLRNFKVELKIHFKILWSNSTLFFRHPDF